MFSIEQDVGENYLPGHQADAQTLGAPVQPGQARLDSQGRLRNNNMTNLIQER